VGATAARMRCTVPGRHFSETVSGHFRESLRAMPTAQRTSTSWPNQPANGATPGKRFKMSAEQ
jgi:hypothetical protein